MQPKRASDDHLFAGVTIRKFNSPSLGEFHDFSAEILSTLLNEFDIVSPSFFEDMELDGSLYIGLTDDLVHWIRWCLVPESTGCCAVDGEQPL